MPRFALPLLLCAVLAGRAGAQSPDSLARWADSVHRAAVRQADSIAQAAARSNDSAFRAANDDRARDRGPAPTRWEDSLRFGRRIRVEVASSRHDGIFVSITRDTVVYRPDAGASLVVASLNDVRGLWVSGGRTSRAQSAGTGAVLGAAVAGFIAAVSNDPSQHGAFEAPATGAVLRAAVLGAGLGFLIGYKSGEREEWHQVWPPQSRE